MQNHLVNLDNWGHCRFENASYMAMVTMGADPETQELCYFLTVIDKETEQEAFQQEFGSLDLAIECINHRYNDFWDFKDLTANKKEGGCSTCVAH
jgi:hypothetical protein